jgi:hypothetical protein
MVDKRFYSHNMEKLLATFIAKTIVLIKGDCWISYAQVVIS